MRMLLQVTFPHGPFNAAVKNGSAGDKIKRILEDAKPEAVYFTEMDGLRTGILIVNMDDVAQIPRYAEPWFLTFEADVRFRAVMSPDDLARGDLDALAKKWG